MEIELNGFNFLSFLIIVIWGILHELKLHNFFCKIKMTCEGFLFCKWINLLVNVYSLIWLNMIASVIANILIKSYHYNQWNFYVYKGVLKSYVDMKLGGNLSSICSQDWIVKKLELFLGSILDFKNKYMVQIFKSFVDSSQWP